MELGMNEELHLIGGPRDGDTVIATEFVPDGLMWQCIGPNGMEHAHYKRRGDSLTFDYVDSDDDPFTCDHENVDAKVEPQQHKPRGFMLRLGRFHVAVFVK